MNRKLIGASLALALALVGSVVVRADEPAKAESQNQPLKMVACPPDCGFSCTSRSEKELIEALKSHAKNFHNVELTDEQARAAIKPAPAPAATETKEKQG